MLMMTMIMLMMAYSIQLNNNVCKHHVGNKARW